MSINLGMPALPPPTLAPRRKTRQIKVGKVLVGGGSAGMPRLMLMSP